MQTTDSNSGLMIRIDHVLSQASHANRARNSIQAGK